MEDELELARMTAERAIETSRLEISKAMNNNSKLESLCRELQKQKNAAVEECKKAAEESDTKRNALELSYVERLKEQEEEQKRLVHDNEVMRKQFQSFMSASGT